MYHFIIIVLIFCEYRHGPCITYQSRILNKNNKRVQEERRTLRKEGYGFVRFLDGRYIGGGVLARTKGCRGVD